MATQFTVKINDKGLGSFKATPAQLQKLQKPMQQALAFMELETKTQFVNQTDPDGRRWQDLKKSTWGRKKSNTILRETGVMINSLYTRMRSPTEGEVGLTAEYALYHQFGTKKMPARPILGFNDTREAKIQAIFEIYVADLLA